MSTTIHVERGHVAATLAFCICICWLNHINTNQYWAWPLLDSISAEFGLRLGLELELNSKLNLVRWVPVDKIQSNNRSCVKQLRTRRFRSVGPHIRDAVLVPCMQRRYLRQTNLMGKHDCERLHYHRQVHRQIEDSLPNWPDRKLDSPCKISELPSIAKAETRLDNCTEQHILL